MTKIKGRVKKGNEKNPVEPKVSIDRSAVQALLDKRVSPLVAIDGANVELISVDDTENLVTVRLGGTYRGSPCRSIVIEYIVTPILAQALNQPIRVQMVD